MAIKRVWIEEWCIGCDASPQSCPEVFRIPEDEVLNEVIEGVDYSRYEQKIIDAAENCPVDAIKYELAPGEGGLD